MNIKNGLLGGPGDLIRKQVTNRDNWGLLYGPYEPCQLYLLSLRDPPSE